MTQQGNVLCVADNHFTLNNYLLRESQKADAVLSLHALKTLKATAPQLTTLPHQE